MPEDFVIERKVLIKYNGKSKTPVIPGDVKKIGPGAFESAKIDTVTIPASVKEICENAFIGSTIKELAVPETVEKIGDGAFSLCQNLHSLTISNGVKKIGAKGNGWIFCICGKLKELNIPESMPRGTGIYNNAGGIQKIELLPTERKIAPFAFDNCWSLREVTIPEGVTKIGYGAFTNCLSLRKIVLPEGVTEIGDRAFENCQRLKTVVVPKSVKRIGANAFLDCYKIGVRTLKNINRIEESFVSNDDYE